MGEWGSRPEPAGGRISGYITDLLLAAGICTGILAVIYFSMEHYQERYERHEAQQPDGVDRKGHNKGLESSLQPHTSTTPGISQRSIASGHSVKQQTNYRRKNSSNRQRSQNRNSSSVRHDRNNYSIDYHYNKLLAKSGLRPDHFESSSRTQSRGGPLRARNKYQSIPVYCAGYGVLTSCKSAMAAKREVHTHCSGSAAPSTCVTVN